MPTTAMYRTLVECMALDPHYAKAWWTALTRARWTEAQRWLQAMRSVRYKAAGSHNMPRHVKGTYQEPKYTVESFDHDILYALRSEPAKQETVTYLSEVLAYLEPQGKPSAMLLATAIEEPVEAIADQWGCSVHNVKKHTVKVRRRLRTWAQWSAA